MRESVNTLKWSASTINSVEDLATDDIVEEIGGVYRYYCYVLADFDPIKASKFYDSCSLEEITKAWLAYRNHNKVNVED